jgi:hypothetical protein
MTETETLATTTDPRLPAAVKKAISGGAWTPDDLRALLKARAKVYKRDGETPEQSYSKAFTGPNPRDVQGARLFALCVDVEKAAPANGPYGHGKVRTNSTSYDANSDEPEQIARDGLRGGPEGSSRLQAIADARKAWRLAVDKIMNSSGVSRSKAVLMLSETPDGKRLIEAERYGAVGA